MAKNNNEFREFLRDDVNINQSRLDRLHTAVRAVSGYLKDNLKGYQKTEPQGSFALGTIIKPVRENDEFDADIQIVMNPNPDWKPKDYIKAVYDTLKTNQNYSDKLRPKTRCVTIDYAGDFHLDVVPRVTNRGRHCVCNRLENKFEPTDGNGYRDWFNEKNRITDGNLKKVVRLLKYLRDHKNNYTAKSILLTTLAGKMIKKSDKDKEQVRTVADTLVTVLTRMDAYLQKNPTMPDIKNPVLPSETFNRHWDQKKYANFRDKVHSHTLRAKRAMAESSSAKAIKVWQELFGDSFGKGSSGNNDGGGNGSGSNPKGPGGLRRDGSPLVITAPVRPRPPYAGADTPATQESKMKVIKLSATEVQRLHDAQPDLSYEPERNIISGRLTLSEEFDPNDELLKPLAPPYEPDSRMAIHDAFDIEVRLEFQPSVYNPWPTVVETGGRIQKIMGEQGISDIADMHCYPGFTENICCLGFQVDTGEVFRLPEFLREFIVPFFYRVAYVERYGLEAARRNLWPEYSHSFERTEREYLSELRAMRGTGRNQPCPCGSRMKYKRCHLSEVAKLRVLLNTQPGRATGS